MPTIQLQQGTIHYEEAGPRDGRPVVFVHGYLMGGDLWAVLGERLAARGLRAIMPTWPLGAHPEPMARAPTSPRAASRRSIAAFLEALDLDDVVLVGNDTGGALCQVVAVDHPERLGALVLTNCDMYENFPPSFFKALVAAAKLPGGLKAALQPMRTRGGAALPARLRAALARRRRPPRARVGEAGASSSPPCSRTCAASPSPSTTRSRSTRRARLPASASRCCSPGRRTTSCSRSSSRSGSRRRCPAPAWRRSSARGRSR